MMKIRRQNTVEVSVMIGCCLVIVLTAVQIISIKSKPAIHVRRRPLAATFHKPAYPAKPTLTKAQKEKLIKTRIALTRSRIALRLKIRQEIQALERAIAKLMRSNLPSPQESNEQIMSDIYSHRIQSIIQAAQRTRFRPEVNQSAYVPKLNHQNSSSKLSSAPSSLFRNSLRRPNNSHSFIQAQRYGIPFPFTSNSQEVSGSEVSRNRNQVLMNHLNNLDKEDENRMRQVMARAEEFGEQNISTSYEDNFYKIKREFQEGTELLLDEEERRRQEGGNIELCPASPESLVGNNTDIILNMTVEIEDIIYNNSDVAEGGEWRPSNCAPRYRVAIIVPYRDRWAHLKILLHYLIPTLKRQLIHFRIFVVEQFGNETFNKGRIMNAAFREALKLFDFHCVTFHDVDLVPEDDRNMYTCTEQPKHMSHGIDKFKYILPYQGLVGGVLMFKREHFQLVNGYSNMYWGWGAEDDDMTTRILYRGLRIYRPPSTIAKYKMVKHHGRKSSEVAVRMRLLRSAAKRSRLEGLNNVNYTLVSLHIAKLFTHFIVDIGRQTD